MAQERFWDAILAIPLTSNGSPLGILTIADTSEFYTKQLVVLDSDTQSPANFQVQETLSPTQIVLGPIGPKVGKQNFSDISSYLVSDNAKISAPQQPKSNIPPDDHYKAIYMPGPVADRVISVDPHGRTYNQNNPIPTQTVGSAVNKDWDRLTLARDAVTQDITSATYKKAGQTVQTLTLTYDENENLEEVIKS